ncbi:MAG: hypothetical protein ACI4V1_04460, partial [Eubacteriales bacterium]
SVVMLVLMGAAIVVEWIHWVPVVAAVFYPRLVIFVRGIVQKVRTKSEPAAEPAADQTTSAAAWEDDEEETDEFEKFVSGFSRTPIPKPEPHSEAHPAEPEEPAQQAEPKE